MDLAHPVYVSTVYHGYFGRKPNEAGAGTFTWKRTNRVDDLTSALGTRADGVATAAA